MLRRLTVLLLASAFALSEPARAAVEGASDYAPEPSLDQDLAQDELGAEKPPTPEPPYPGSEQGGFAADPSTRPPTEVKPQPFETATETAEAPPAEPPPSRPLRIDEDENYYYGKETPQATFSGNPAIEAPTKIKGDGEYHYDVQPKAPAYQGAPGVERPVEMRASGEFQYRVEHKPSKHSASFSFGLMTPPNITNSSNHLNFARIYGDTPVPIILINYELMRMNTPIGRLGLVLGSGIAAASAQGHFKNPSRSNEVPDERYTFALFPNSVTAHYRFQFSDKQIFVPFVFGGGGYYTVAEIRDDGARPKAGGGAVAIAGGGVHFLMDWADMRSMRKLESEYGINHVWLTLEGRGAGGLGSELDFTSASGNAGFMMEF